MSACQPPSTSSDLTCVIALQATKVKVVVAQSGDIKAGVKKSLRKGCDLTVGYKVKASDLSDPSKHTIGFTLDIK